MYNSREIMYYVDAISPKNILFENCCENNCMFDKKGDYKKHGICNVEKQKIVKFEIIFLIWVLQLINVLPRELIHMIINIYCYSVQFWPE